MTQLTGAQLLVRLLERQGVRTIAGIPGGAILPFYDALSGSELIRHVLARHEQGAGFMAQGMARVSGVPQVCIASSGPGATNLVTAIADASLDSIPMVIITGQVPLSMIGTDAFQEVDIYGITVPITKHNFLVRSAQELLEVIPEAFRIAMSGRPGPVLVDVPKDVQNQLVEVGQLPPPAGGQRGGDVVGLQDVQHPARVGGGVVKTFAQQAVVQHQRLARRPLQIGVALGQHLRRCTQLQRALRKTAALRHQLVEGVDRAQRNAAQQQGDQHKGQQQQLLERAAQRPGCAHPAVTRAGAALLRAGQFHHAASSPALRSPSHWPSGPPAAARSGWR